MSTNLAPALRQFYYDSNGNPLSGGLLYSYQAGTTTPQVTYTDSTGGTPNANPVVLDASGGASVWLDPSLSYKFVLKDVNSVQQWSVDNVIGTLAGNSVTTASIQDSSVTTAKIADASVTIVKLAAEARKAPTKQVFTSTGTATGQLFKVSAANATAGATYTNNGNTYTVLSTIAGGTLLFCSNGATPLASGTLTKTSGIGDATITFSAAGALATYTAPTGPIPLYIRVRMVGGGGGGGGSAGGGAGTLGGDGGATAFGTSLLVANGGQGGQGGTTNPATGGTASLGSGPVGVAITGGSGTGPSNNVNADFYLFGPAGASTPLGGGGAGGAGGVAGTAAPANSGAGGGGAGTNNSANSQSGAGGAAGGFIDAIITSPAASYYYGIGAGGAAGAAGASGFVGGAGGSGLIEVTEHYQ